MQASQSGGALASAALGRLLDRDGPTDFGQLEGTYAYFDLNDPWSAHRQIQAFNAPDPVHSWICRPRDRRHDLIFRLQQKPDRAG